MNVAELEPRPLGASLREFLRQSPEVRHSKAALKWNAIWAEVAGPEIASHTRVRGIRRNVLTIAVDSPPLCHELASFRRGELLAAMNARVERAQAIEDLHFRHGPL